MFGDKINASSYVTAILFYLWRCSLLMSPCFLKDWTNKSQIVAAVYPNPAVRDLDGSLTWEVEPFCNDIGELGSSSWASSWLSAQLVFIVPHVQFYHMHLTHVL